jgi:hypothetical protein
MSDLVYAASGITAVGSVEGTFQQSNLEATGITAVGSIGGGSYLYPNINYTSSGITAIGTIGGNFWQLPKGDSFVWTSKIGAMVFTKASLGDEINSYAMSWSGYVYQILPLPVGAVVYGKNGITLMTPYDVKYGSRNIHPIGIKGRNAAVRTKNGHVFIDRNGFLGMVGNDGSLQTIDYSNYFTTMSSALVMTYNEALDIVNICDGTYGYELSQWGLGKGPVMVTGMGNRDGTLYVTASTTLAFDPLEVTVDIFDFGTRSIKTITGFEVSTYTTKDLYGAVSYRYNKADAFSTTPWIKADRYGKVYVAVSGVEFKFLAKLGAYEAIKIDMINVMGLSEAQIQ